MSNDKKINIDEKLKNIVSIRNAQYQSIESFKEKFAKKIQEKSSDSVDDLVFHKPFFLFTYQCFKIASIILIALIITVMIIFDKSENLGSNSKSKILLTNNNSENNALIDELVSKISTLFNDSDLQVVFIDNEVSFAKGSNVAQNNTDKKYLCLELEGHNNKIERIVIPIINNNNLSIKDDQKNIMGSVWTYNTGDGFLCVDADLRLKNGKKILKKNLIINTKKNTGGYINVRVKV